jgi:phosphonate transport system substrate-binding protein
MKKHEFSPRRRALLAVLPVCLLAGPALARTQEWIFVVHPFETPSRLFERFRPLTLYLAGALGRPLRLVIAATYDEQIAMISDGRAQLAYLGPTPYVRVRERARVEILAGEAEAGQAFYQSAIVTRADSPIQRLADLKGRSLALGAEISMSSAVAPKLMLAQAGVKLADLAGYAHLDRHERVALSVLHNDFDAGGLRLDIARGYLPRGLRIIAISPPLPPHVIVASPDLPPEAQRQARFVLLHPDATGLAALRKLGDEISFVEINDGHYQSVRQMLKGLSAP